MAWVNWSRKGTSPPTANGGCLGLDLDASRARAVSGMAARHRILLLDDPHPELPLAVSLEKRSPEIGRAGISLSRRLPHLLCAGHLPFLGQPQEWKAGRHRLDAESALALVFDKLRISCASFANVFVGLPAYLTPPQIAKLTSLAAKNRLPFKAAAGSALALAVDGAAAMQQLQPAESEAREDWIVPLRRGGGKQSLPADVVVVDADDHALTGSLIRIEYDHVRLLATKVLPKLSVRAWKDRLLDSFSDRCVRVCRRDPRDSGEAEQLLFEQIDDSLDRIRLGQKVTLNVRSAHWYQDLELQPEDFESYCAPLLRPAVEGIRDLLSAASPLEPPRTVWLTHEAGRLPGLARALHQNMAECTSIGVLRPESVATAVANLGERWLAGELANAHLDASIPIRLALPETKPALPAVKSHRFSRE